MARLRTVAKLVRFSPDEIARISERARACGRAGCDLAQLVQVVEATEQARDLTDGDSE
jgi:hypothetical protein